MIHRIDDHVIVIDSSELRGKEDVWTAFLDDLEPNLLHLIQRSEPL